MAVKERAALAFIFVTVLIDVIGLGVIIPVMPRLIRELTGEGLSAASRYAGWLTFAYASMQFLCSPLLGALSDRFGRRPVLLFSLLGLGIDYIFLALAPTWQWLLVGRVIAGIAGASFTTATAYIADVSAPEKRAQNFGLVGAAFGLGFIVGPALGGYCSEWGTRAPFFVSAGLSLLNLLYGWLVLPESLDLAHRRAFSWQRASPWGGLLQLRRYPVVAGLVLSLLLVYVASHAVQSTWTFFTMLRFGWTEKMVGYSLACVGVLTALVQGGLIRVTMPRLGLRNSVYIGLLLYALGLALFAVAGQGWQMFAFLVPYCLGGITGPALQGIISGQVPANEQGELQGGLTSLISLTTIIGPPIMTNLFAYFTGPHTPVHFPGASFLAGSLLAATSLGFAYRSLQRTA